MTNETRERLQEAVLNQLVREGGQDSVSSVRDALRFDGWRGLGSSSRDFEHLLASLGFTLTPVYKKVTRKTPAWGNLPVVKTLVTL